MSSVDEGSCWTIETASRLHFGLLAFNVDDQRRQHGGVGMMVQQPGFRVSARTSASFSCEGPLANRVHAFANRFAESRGQSRPPNCEISVERVAAEHAGLGSGTQLGLAVSALLWQCEIAAEAPSTERPAAPQLANWVGRGRRSSIGTHGFDRGGLIYEQGKHDDEPFGQLVAHVVLPQTWRVVLWTQEQATGLSGQAEQLAFDTLPTVRPETTATLQDLATKQIVPAAKAANLDAMGDAIYHYGHLAGTCFASQQGGPFANKQLESWVAAVRQRGVTGVGQSSWGPSLFAILKSDEAARDFLAWLRRDVTRDAAVQTWITPIAGQGTQLRQS